jgi:hypothetical protein
LKHKVSQFYHTEVSGKGRFRPDFLFLQAAMEPFDVAVALRVMIGRAPCKWPFYSPVLHRKTPDFCKFELVTLQINSSAR